MADPQGAKLYVNLSASQARRRLKGFGHGVRKIHSAGKNQSLVIHTATGKHRDELESQFADVGFSHHPDRLDIPIESLRNLGVTSAAWLREVHIRTKDDLQRLGPAVVFRLVKQRQPKASLNLLWALAAALQEIDWRDLPEQAKRELRAELEVD